ncbi:MAG: hypothetical protein GX240_00855 [Candidatus Atribacteria bacterium]|nr:hypothetical protein [Candidatus Atribacteria bacterium]
MSRLNRVLLVIVVILAAATALVWFRPDMLDMFMSFSWADLNPFKGRNIATELDEESTATAGVQLPSEKAIAGPSQTGIAQVSSEKSKVDDKKEVEIIEEEKELTFLEKDINRRQESYQSKIFTYEPYQIPVRRNPFQRVVNTVYFSEAEEIIAQGLDTEEELRRFVYPELPPGTKCSGFISSGDNKLAIIELDGETYIVKEGDTLLDHYVVSSIETDRVVIDINGYPIPIKLGGEEASNE